MIDCLVKVFDFEAQTTKKKKVLKCSKCPIREKCEKWVRKGNESVNQKLGRTK